MRRMAILALLLAAMLVAAGCAYVPAKDRLVIHDHYLNAVAINAKVQADPALPPYAKTWWAAEARTWRAMDAWAKGEDLPGAEDK